MKRCWMGLVLLIVLLVLGLGITWAMAEIHDPIARDLKQAAQQALQGNWAEAEHLSQKAVTAWEKWAHFRACFADHDPTEEIDAALAAMAVYRGTEEDAAFGAACLDLARKIEAIGDAHGLVWWNIM